MCTYNYTYMIYASAMAHPTIIIFIQLLLISSYPQVKSTKHGFISIEISDVGLNFVKDLVINHAVSSLIPLQLPQIEKSVKIPVVGSVDMVLSNIVINQVNISSSIIQSGETGIAIVASGATADLSMEWKYSYSTWLLPTISDKGDATVQVEGMEIGLTVNLENQQGTLNLSVLDYGCYVEDLSIKLDGGASWLYQGLVDAFEGKISSAIEDAISSQIRDGITKTDSLLQSLPKEIVVYEYAAINVTLVNPPVLSNSKVQLEIDGLFTAEDKLIKTSSNNYHSELLQDSVHCENPDKMIKISMHELVLNSAFLAYYNANVMHWVVDKLPDQSLLNTAGWRHIIPKLYKQYPDEKMNLNISLSSPPVIEIEKNNSIVANINLDVTINVLDGGNVVPVACFSMAFGISGFAEISRYTFGGGVKLREFELQLKWSNIGYLHIRLVKTVMLTVLKSAVLPFVNFLLKLGFPLPIFHGYRLENAQLFCADSMITICSDVAQSQNVFSI